MVSDDAVAKIAEVMRRRLSNEQCVELIEALKEEPGDNSFRDIVARLEMKLTRRRLIPCRAEII
jgi:hypothetical protein